jgi:integrase
MIDRHWDGIAAYCKPENKVSLGFVEGLNNKIRVLQRRAYGLRDEEYRRRLKKTDADYFNLTEREGRITRARLEKVVPTLEDVQRVIKSMPFGTDIERRDRALVAFTLLTAGRDGAVVTLKLKHVDVARQHVRWDAREVATKFRKSFDTYFYPVGDDMRQIVEENGSRSWRRSWGGGGTIP